MATPSKDDVLSFDILVDIKASLQAMEKFSKSMKRSMKQIATSGQKMGQQGAKAAKDGEESTTRWVKAVEKLNEAYEYHDEILKQRGETLRELRELYKTVSKEDRKQAADGIKSLENEYKLQLKVAKVAKTTRVKGGLGSRALTPGLRKAMQGARDIGGELEGSRGMKQALKKAGEALKEPLEEFLKKDAHGLIERASKITGGALARGFHGTRLLGRAGGIALNRKGEQKIAAGKAAGGFKGALQQAGGQGMKGAGELLSGLSKLIRPLATIGPLLQASIVGLVKVFIDLDAEVREFNKGIMESTSNLEFLGRTGGNVERALSNMQDALDGARRAATDQSFNNALGITKDTHTAILNTLTQEGVAFGKLAGDAGNTAEGMKELTQSIVAMGVSYSRSLGVPLQEITSMQAEMMVEMGKSTEETGRAFAMMTSAAEQSGIAGNKFFNIVRGLSTDLGLFNLRMEDSVALLGKLGKVMSPRNAQKFMQEATQGLKSMGRQEKLKLSLFAGTNKTKQIVDKDIERKTANLVAKLAEKTGESESSLRSRFESRGYAGIKDAIDQFGEQSGALADSAQEIQFQRTQNKKGTYGTAMATADLGIGGGLELKQQALRAFSKFSKISDALGSMELETVAENLGMSDEQVKQWAKLETAIDAQREELKKRGIDSKNMGYDDIIATMTDEMQKSLRPTKDQSPEEKMLELAKGQGQKTQSFQEKIANFVDWVMNALYDLLVDIWEAVTSLTKWGDDKARVEQKRALWKTKDPGLIKAFDSSTGSGGKLDAKKFEDTFKPLLAAKLKKLDSSETARERVAKSVGSVSSANAEFYGEKEFDHRRNRILGMVQKSRVGSAKRNALSERLNSVGPEYTGDIDLMGVMKELGFTIEEQSKVLAQAHHGLTMSDLVDLSNAIGGTGGALPGAPEGSAAGPAASSPAGQAAEAQETTNAQLETVVTESEKTQGILKQQGIKIAPPTLKESAKGMEASMLSALRTALFEYYMYSGTDRGTLLKAMQEGGAMPGNVGQRFVAGAMRTTSTTGAVDDLRKPLVAQGNAMGGIVTGVARGMAVVAAQGEGLASVGKGERIVPSGGGAGSGVNVVVNGIGGPDLARLIEGKVVEGIREYRRREKFH